MVGILLMVPDSTVGGCNGVAEMMFRNAFVLYFNRAVAHASVQSD